MALWLEPLRPQRLDQGCLELICPSQLHCNTVGQRYLSRLERRLDALLPGARLNLRVAESRPGAPPTPPAGAAAHNLAAAPPKPSFCL